jgi:hypothetical protein
MAEVTSKQNKSADSNRINSKDELHCFVTELCVRTVAVDEVSVLQER